MYNRDNTETSTVILSLQMPLVRRLIQLACYRTVYYTTYRTAYQTKREAKAKCCPGWTQLNNEAGCTYRKLMMRQYCTVYVNFNSFLHFLIYCYFLRSLVFHFFRANARSSKTPQVSVFLHFPLLPGGTRSFTLFSFCSDLVLRGFNSHAAM